MRQYQANFRNSVVFCMLLVYRMLLKPKRIANQLYLRVNLLVVLASKSILSFFSSFEKLKNLKKNLNTFFEKLKKRFLTWRKNQKNSDILRAYGQKS
jgi:formate-dependent nitrite reductase cytochrome c552 subunit